MSALLLVNARLVNEGRIVDTDDADRAHTLGGHHIGRIRAMPRYVHLQLVSDRDRTRPERDRSERTRQQGSVVGSHDDSSSRCRTPVFHGRPAGAR